MTKVTVEDQKPTPESVTLDSVHIGLFYRIVSWEQNPALLGKLVFSITDHSVILIDKYNESFRSVVWDNSDRNDMKIRLAPVKKVKITVID